MKLEYDGVRFYSRYDGSVCWQLKKAEPILIAFCKDKEYDSINEIIELYNIQELIDCGISLSEWSDETYNGFMQKAEEITSVIAKFFSLIHDDNFIEYIQNVAIGYLDDFWTLFERFKVYERISAETFTKYLELPDTALYRILKHKDIVREYDVPLANELRVSDQTCRILVTQFLELNDIKYYLPISFKPSEFESVFQKYVYSERVNPKILKLIFASQSSNECPIGDKTKLIAKQKHDEYWRNSSGNVIAAECGLEISLADQYEYKKCMKLEEKYLLSYDIKWLEESLDYPTILNNFCYVFGMFDLCWRSTLVSVKSQIDALEDAFATKGIKFYPRGSSFQSSAMISFAQMKIYYDFLRDHNVDLENVFAWFFTEYLEDEFGVKGFYMKASSATDYAEKCRTLVSEMEGVLKQYRMYVRDGNIDRALYEMSSEHLVIDDIPSFISNKYAYGCSDDIQQEMFLLFSDQSLLSYIEKTKDMYPTLFELLKNETITMEDFEKFQIASLNWLISRGTIMIDKEGNIGLNTCKVKLLKDLYDHDVICVHHLGKLRAELEKMIAAGDLKIESALFSIPEKDYLNFELNKAEYSDGLDLRNKYSHSTYPQDEEAQRHDYIELLKIMVLIISKINEEFCLRDELKESKNDVQ